MYKRVEDFRNENGFITLNKLENYVEKGEVVEGSHAKHWFNVNGVRFLFKEYDDLLPSFGEVLYSKVANTCGVECAKYDFAIYNGKVGTISYDFLGKEEAYYNFLELTAQFTDTKFKLEEIMNNRDLLVLYNNKYNNLVSIKNLLNDLFVVSEEEKKATELELVKMFCLDCMFIHKDRRLWNYGVIVDEISDNMRLAPVHDNSYVLCLEKGEEYIKEVIYSLINGGSIDKIQSEYSMMDDDSLSQLIKFYRASDNEVKREIEFIVNKVNVEEEVNNLSLVCKIGDIPMLWIKALLNYRKSSILNEIESVKILEEDGPKKPNVTFSKRK